MAPRKDANWGSFVGFFSQNKQRMRRESWAWLGLEFNGFDTSRAMLEDRQNGFYRIYEHA